MQRYLRVCSFLLNVKNVLKQFVFFAFFFFCLGSSSAAEHVLVAGTGDSEALLQKVAQLFMDQNPEIIVDVPPSIGSSGGIRGLLQGQVDLARTARPLKAEEQDGSLLEYVFAVSPIVFVVNPSVTGIRGLTTEQIVAIYDGSLTLWSQVGGPPSRIYPVDREQGDSSRSIIEQHMAGFRDLVSVAKVFYTTPEMVKAISLHAYTVGFLPLGLARAHRLKVLSVDGVAADFANVQNCRYPYVSRFAVVAKKSVSESARKFIDFLYTDEIGALIRQWGLVPQEKKV